MPKLPQFEARHDWPSLQKSFIEHIQAGGNVAGFAVSHNVPLHTINKKVARWKKDAAASLSTPKHPTTPGANMPGPTGNPDTGGASVLNPAEEAQAILAQALPVAARALVAQLTTPDGQPSRDAQATRAALQMLKDLQHKDDQAQASPYAGMTDAEIHARAATLWPGIAEARQLLAHGDASPEQARPSADADAEPAPPTARASEILTVN